MVADIALALSILNTILWILFIIGLRNIFKRMYPMFKSMGLVGSQNLMYSSVYDKMGEPPELADADIKQ